MDLLRVNQLKKSFANDDGEKCDIIDIESFVLEEAEICGLSGESGSGKTTFLHLLAGILTPDSGSIEFLGVDTGLLSSSERDNLRADKIGYIFQSFNLLQGFTALENLEIAMSFSSSSEREYALELLDKVGLSNRLEYYPHQLSIGQQQRVALARALVNKPKIVLADEPTGNLDSLNAAKVFELLCNLCTDYKSALLMVTHDQVVLESFEKKVDLRNLNRSALFT